MVRSNDILISESVKTITNANHVATVSDYALIFSTGNDDRTLTLPAPSTANQGQRLFVKKIDSGTGKVIIDADTVGGSTIDGETSIDVDTQYGGVEILCTGNIWVGLAEGRTPKSLGYSGALDCATTSVGTFVNGHLVSAT